MNSAVRLAAADEVAAGRHTKYFPIDVFQTGSGTSTNMNANEVIARLASQTSGLEIRPNDHVNCGQSSNDVIPTVIHVAACLALDDELLPALNRLRETLERRGHELSGAVKTSGQLKTLAASMMKISNDLRWMNSGPLAGPADFDRTGGGRGQRWACRVTPH